MKILGIGGWSHNASLTLIENGMIVFAIEVERITRRKNDGLLDPDTLRSVFEEMGVNISDLDLIAFADRYIYNSEVGKKIVSALSSRPITVFDHHLCHAASSYFCSEFDNAAVISIDGKGDGLSSLICLGSKDDGLVQVGHSSMEYSLGRLWNAANTIVGMPGYYNSGKTMALSSYGKADVSILDLVNVSDTGSITFHWNRKPKEFFFEKDNLIAMMQDLFDLDILESHSLLTQKYFDFIASLQELTGHIMAELGRAAFRQGGKRPICLAGGVGLNVLANTHLQKEMGVPIYVQPAASDAGLSLGAAILGWHKLAGTHDHVQYSPYLGRSYDKSQITKILSGRSCGWSEVSDPSRTAAELIENGMVVAWFQGREEFGPRALGNRSMLADPRNPKNRQYINETVKEREWFRPLAPSIAEESLAHYFQTIVPSPFMLFAPKATPAAEQSIPAVLHADNTGRVQTVTAKSNRQYYSLINHFADLTGISCVLNTSFNLRGQPIVGSPEDALECFLDSQIDYLLIEDVLVSKKH